MKRIKVKAAIITAGIMTILALMCVCGAIVSDRHPDLLLNLVAGIIVGGSIAVFVLIIYNSVLDWLKEKSTSRQTR